MAGPLRHLLGGEDVVFCNSAEAVQRVYEPSGEFGVSHMRELGVQLNGYRPVVRTRVNPTCLTSSVTSVIADRLVSLQAGGHPAASELFSSNSYKLMHAAPIPSNLEIRLLLVVVLRFLLPTTAKMTQCCARFLSQGLHRRRLGGGGAEYLVSGSEAPMDVLLDPLEVHLLKGPGQVAHTLTIPVVLVVNTMGPNRDDFSGWQFQLGRDVCFQFNIEQDYGTGVMLRTTPSQSPGTKIGYGSVDPDRLPPGWVFAPWIAPTPNQQLFIGSSSFTVAEDTYEEALALANAREAVLARRRAVAPAPPPQVGQAAAAAGQGPVDQGARRGAASTAQQQQQQQRPTLSPAEAALQAQQRLGPSAAAAAAAAARVGAAGGTSSSSSTPATTGRPVYGSREWVEEWAPTQSATSGQQQQQRPRRRGRGRGRGAGRGRGGRSRGEANGADEDEWDADAALQELAWMQLSREGAADAAAGGAAGGRSGGGMWQKGCCSCLLASKQRLGQRW